MRGWTRSIAAAGCVLTAMMVAMPPRPAIAEGDTGPALIILVRHAEEASRPADDPGITAVGKKRADDLAAALRDAGITAILTSPLLRTIETAKPLASALGLDTTVVPFDRSVKEHIAAVAAAVRSRRGVVLMVGHSNTVPAVIAALGGPRLPDLCEFVYDQLFILVRVDGKTNLARTRFGAADAKPDPSCR